VRKSGSDQEAAILSNVYRQLSVSMNIPLIDTLNELMPKYSTLQSAWYLHDGSGYHLNEEGQGKLSDFILTKIIP
jgi:hypothetical protein